MPNTDSCAFYDSNISSATLHVPAASLEAYRTTAPWSGFGTIVALPSDDIEPVFISSLSELSNDKQYLIHTRNKARGSLTVKDNHLATTNPSGTGQYCVPKVLLDETTPLITSTSQLSSPYTDPTVGSLAGLIDGNAGTFWHSTWQGGSVAAGTHYLQVEMPSHEDIEAAFRFTRRSSADNDHVTEWGVYGTNDFNAEKADCEQLAEIETPFIYKTETRVSDVFSTKGYAYLRFYIDNTAGTGITATRGYGHIAEFQLYPAEVNNDAKEKPFALLEDNGKFYLYSVRDKAFITYANQGDETAFPWQKGDNLMNIYEKDGSFVFDFAQNGYTLNVNTTPGIAINTWGTQTNLFDDGNLLSIEEVGDFDPTEALAAINTYAIEVGQSRMTSLYTFRDLIIPDDDDLLGVYYGKRIEDDVLSLGRVRDIVPARTPVLVMANPGTYTFPRSYSEEPALSGNLLRGADTDLATSSISGTVYAFDGSGTMPCFYAFDEPALPACSVYLVLSAGNGVKELRIGSGGTVVGVDEISTDEPASPTYDLSGRMVNGNLPQGIFTRNGKKFVIK